MSAAMEAALVALRAGLSTIPPRKDGTKAPYPQSWKQYQQSIPSQSDVESWYSTGLTGVGLVTGSVSGNLECLDFDTHRVWEQYKEAAKQAGLTDLVRKVWEGYAEQSPNGFHLLYQCSEIDGNTKLAQAADSKTLIETRGEGGYIITAPSTGVNPAGDYVLKAGGFYSIVRINPEERRLLHALARIFDEVPRDEYKPQRLLSDSRPGDEYIKSTTWADVLEPHGWTVVFERNGTTYWRRPDKSAGISATTGHNGSDLLYVFSTSTVFDSERGYNRFTAYTLLNHGGDFKAAATALSGRGYGSKAAHGVRSEAPRRGNAACKRPDAIVEEAVTICMADVKSEPIQWLWPGRIALGKVTMIAGDPGLGKSLVTITLAAHVSQGYPWPVDLSTCPQGGVVMLSAEDDPADTIRPRLDAAGANASYIYMVTMVREHTDDGIKEHCFSLDRDLVALDGVLTRTAACKLVIIDPISAYLGGTDSHKNADIRALLSPLAALASKHKVAIVVVTHLNKSAQTNALYRATGSLAFVAAARAVFAVTKDKDDPTRRLMLPIKNNLGKDTSGFAYKVDTADNDAPVVTWERDPVEITAEEALTPASDADHSEREEAVTWLLDVLAEGPIQAKEMQTLAREAGHSWSTIKRAKKEASVASTKQEFSGKWVWEIPTKGLTQHEGAQSNTVSPLGVGEPLGGAYRRATEGE